MLSPCTCKRQRPPERMGRDGWGFAPQIPAFASSLLPSYKALQLKGSQIRAVFNITAENERHYQWNCRVMKPGQAISPGRGAGGSPRRTDHPLPPVQHSPEHKSPHPGLPHRSPDPTSHSRLLLAWQGSTGSDLEGGSGDKVEHFPQSCRNQSGLFPPLFRGKPSTHLLHSCSGAWTQGWEAAGAGQHFCPQHRDHPRLCSSRRKDVGTAP